MCSKKRHLGRLQVSREEESKTGFRPARRLLPTSGWCCSEKTVWSRHSPEWTNTPGTRSTALNPATHTDGDSFITDIQRFLRSKQSVSIWKDDWRTSNYMWTPLEQAKETLRTFMELRSMSFLSGQHWCKERERSLIFIVSPPSYIS